MDHRLIIVGGVPGAGKSTALASYIGLPGIIVLDPDRVRDQLRWRPLVHLVHQTAAWMMILLGPRVVGRTVILHETATRRNRREAMLGWAVRRRWRPRILLIDVERHEALWGQSARGRMVPRDEFDRHWARWEQLRSDGLDTSDSVHREIVPQHAIHSTLERVIHSVEPLGA